MAEKKTKKERVKIETRAPQKRGIFDNLGKDRQPNVKHPLSEIIIFPDDAVKDNRSDSPTILPTYLPTNLPIPNKTQPVSPEKDFSARRFAPINNFDLFTLILLLGCIAPRVRE